MTAASLPLLDLATFMQGPAPRRKGFGLPIVAAVGLLAIGLAAWLAYVRYAPPATASQVVRIELAQARAVAAMTVDDRAQIIAEGEDAQSRNAAIPFAVGAAVPMGAFHLAAPTATVGSALRCLTQAIYYEAATEPLAGRRAVAQVVLNRVRHPAYPKSVCGVVYQGAQLSTGCQFSFTCDGSLLRQPMAGPWREAEVIARQALAGHVEAEVGTATHYHADYVLPRWAFEMAKITRLGRHLFYRFEGTWGRSAFFNGAYSGREAIPALDFARLRERLLARAEVPAPTETFAAGLTVAPHVTDRHTDNDVGGRIDTTRAWRLTIPDPVQASSRYRALIDESGQAAIAGPTGPASSTPAVEAAR
jgi:spore germination cell wall hydrolase CwlJ-like protein